jgi:large conductance mechanosensitive channel
VSLRYKRAISFAIFWVIKAVTRLHLRSEPAPADPPRSEVLLDEIRDAIRSRS